MRRAKQEIPWALTGTMWTISFCAECLCASGCLCDVPMNADKWKGWALLIHLLIDVVFKCMNKFTEFDEVFL